MNDRYRLGGLDDVQLLAGLAALVKRENDCLSELLAHLAEIDDRGVCVALGYSSLFAYCTEALGFCKSSAGRRIAAARVCRAFPEAFARVANGELQLSVLCALRPHLNAENACELFAACSRKSYEHVEELLASRFPKQDVRDLIRRLPAPRVDTPDIGSKHAEPLPSELEAPAPWIDAAAEPALPLVPQLQGERSRPPLQRGAVKPLSAERFSVNFTADAAFRDLLEEVRALLSHARPKGDLMHIMKLGLEALRTELLKKRFGVGRKPRRVRSRANETREASESPEHQSASLSGTHVGVKRTRHVPAVVAREVYARDQGRCTFCAHDGRRCGERRLLQVDHVIPHAEGGEATVDNLRLRCRAHNLHTAREHFGRQWMRAAVERGRKRMRRAGFDPQRFEPDSPNSPNSPGSS
jgi:5-methylcytosine-specific restriction endonuclease McrA